MAVLAKVASGVKRRIPSNSGNAQHLVSRPQHSVSQAPDLKRWSDFMNPFPPVGPGGYTKYYKSRSGDQADLQFQLPPLCQINYFSPPQHSRLSPSPKTPSQSSQKSHSRPDKATLPRLTSIPESTSENPNSQSPTSTVQSPKGSLRRKKRRLLRTPSIERDFADARALFASQTTLDRSGSTSSSHSSATQRTHLSSSTSDDSNFSPTSTESDDMPLTPLTPSDDNIRGSDFNYLSKDPYTKRHDVDDGLGGFGGEYNGHESFQRPESWATYRTARSQFSEV